MASRGTLARALSTNTQKNALTDLESTRCSLTLAKNNNSVYAFASPGGRETGLIRIGGAGLANLLFSWARCSAFSNRTGARQLYTTWPQVKKSAWVRWERDKRLYANLFRPLKDEVSGIEKLVLLTSLPKVPEEEHVPHDRKIVVFSGLKNYFMDFCSESEFLYSRLKESASDPSCRRSASLRGDPYVAVHVRMGDALQFSAGRLSVGNMRLPLQWYETIIEQMRCALGAETRFVISSDGTPSELARLLALPKVSLLPGGSAIGDLLELANAATLVGSCSTFSQWGAFLGRMPSVWHPRFDRHGGLGGPLETVSSEEGYIASPDLARIKQEFEKRLSVQEVTSSVPAGAFCASAI